MTTERFRARGNKNPWSNPSRKAIAKLLNPLPKPKVCPCCCSAVRLVENDVIYGRHYGEWPYAFLCVSPKCGAYVGLHPYTDIPLGTLADEPTRKARRAAKARFNPMFESGAMTRTEAYEWLAQQLGLPVGECHIGWFGVDQCRRVETLCARHQKGGEHAALA